MSSLGQTAGMRHAVLRAAGWTACLYAHLPVRVQKTVLHFGGTAVSLLRKHCSFYGILNICLFCCFVLVLILSITHKIL